MPNDKNYVSPESYEVIKAHWDTAAKQSCAFYNTWSSFQYFKSIQWISWKLKLCYWCISDEHIQNVVVDKN